MREPNRATADEVMLLLERMKDSLDAVYDWLHHYRNKLAAAEREVAALKARDAKRDAELGPVGAD